MSVLLYNICLYFLLFLIYSFIGWLIEVLSGFATSGKWVNRGFLIGPIVPIWGCGAILITFILKSSDGIFNLIVSSAFIGSALEYFVNYIMEKLFKARWWDYSHLPFNVNGRVWLGSSALFGIGGLIIVKYSNPFLFNFLLSFDKKITLMVSFILFIIMATDLIISFKIIKKLKISAYSLKKDYTEEISKKVNVILTDKSKSFSRLFKAFPDINFPFLQKK